VTNLLFWVFMVILNGGGVEATVYSSREECEIDRTEAMLKPGALGITPCVEMPLEALKKDKA
jgi:hypothetical protein